MSKIEAKVVQILNEENLNIVFFESGTLKLQMISLELDDIKIGDKVILHVNPSHIAISKDKPKNLSIDNVVSSKIISIEKEKLLSTLKLQVAENFFLNVLLTTKSFEKLSLHVNENVFALINASEISISKKL